MPDILHFQSNQLVVSICKSQKYVGEKNKNKTFIGFMERFMREHTDHFQTLIVFVFL